MDYFCEMLIDEVENIKEKHKLEWEDKNMLVESTEQEIFEVIKKFKKTESLG